MFQTSSYAAETFDSICCAFSDPRPACASETLAITIFRPPPRDFGIPITGRVHFVLLIARFGAPKKFRLGCISTNFKLRREQNSRKTVFARALAHSRFCSALYTIHVNDPEPRPHCVQELYSCHRLVHRLCNPSTTRSDGNIAHAHLANCYEPFPVSSSLLHPYLLKAWNTCLHIFQI